MPDEPKFWACMRLEIPRYAVQQVNVADAVASERCEEERWGQLMERPA